ncbi:MAG: Hsp20/alpha crystallin family protein [Kiritimatiellae bacterium]|nr:Hsp20/alpha crystallin family protein [Kiritimatiellia bacterium]MCO5067735.1 Hsp20/alpha crystallin family protein [Kiritimatiellia bacterium]
MTTLTDIQTKRSEQEQKLPVFAPATDVYETAKEIVLFVDVPGVTPDQIDVSLENRTLTISARRTAPDQVEHKAVHREFGSVEYRRTFTLTKDVDRNGIVARIKNGVLRLSLPKAAETQPRRIEVQSEA